MYLCKLGYENKKKMQEHLVNCKYANCYIDGGQEYLHFGENDFNKILIIFDDGTGILPSDEEEYKINTWNWKIIGYMSYLKMIALTTNNLGQL